jgi:hypothetical protein
MKKTLFMAFAVAGFSQFSFAQEAARMSPAPTQAESNRQAQAKAATKESTAAKTPKTDPTTVAEYKKIGLDDNQIAAVNKTNNYYETKKAAISNDSKLTAEEKKNQLAALEAEKNASLQKRLGDDSYKKYTELNNPAATKEVPAKKTTKPASKSNK